VRDLDLLYWGMVVTIFLLISAVLTARQIFENYLEQRQLKEQSDAEAERRQPATPQR
jgi:cell division protein FtsL